MNQKLFEMFPQKVIDLVMTFEEGNLLLAFELIENKDDLIYWCCINDIQADHYNIPWLFGEYSNTGKSTYHILHDAGLGGWRKHDRSLSMGEWLDKFQEI